MSGVTRKVKIWSGLALVVLVAGFLAGVYWSRLGKRWCHNRRKNRLNAEVRKIREEIDKLERDLRELNEG